MNKTITVIITSVVTIALFFGVFTTTQAISADDLLDVLIKAGLIKSNDVDEAMELLDDNKVSDVRSCPIITTNLSRGSKGSVVIRLQKHLENEGYLSIPLGVAYGYYGPLTEQAVYNFQLDRGVLTRGSSGRGIFGPRTRQALVSYCNSIRDVDYVDEEDEDDQDQSDDDSVNVIICSSGPLYGVINDDGKKVCEEDVDDESDGVDEEEEYVQIDTDNISGGLVQYFSDQMNERVLSELGQPIEGSTPEMFLQIYSGLTDEDFEGVRAGQGIYEVVNGELIFRSTLTEGQNMYSGAWSVNIEGMEDLLINLIERHKFSADLDEGAIDNLLKSLI